MDISFFLGGSGLSFGNESKLWVGFFLRRAPRLRLRRRRLSRSSVVFCRLFLT